MPDPRPQLVTRGWVTRRRRDSGPLAGAPGLARRVRAGLAPAFSMTAGPVPRACLVASHHGAFSGGGRLRAQPGWRLQPSCRPAAWWRCGRPRGARGGRRTCPGRARQEGRRGGDADRVRGRERPEGRPCVHGRACARVENVRVHGCVLCVCPRACAFMGVRVCWRHGENDCHGAPAVGLRGTRRWRLTASPLLHVGPTPWLSCPHTVRLSGFIPS